MGQVDKETITKTASEYLSVKEADLTGVLIISMKWTLERKWGKRERKPGMLVSLKTQESSLSDLDATFKSASTNFTLID